VRVREAHDRREEMAFQGFSKLVFSKVSQACETLENPSMRNHETQD